MLVGVPREIKPQERRVGLTPGAVRELVHHGHAVLVETGAGAGIGEADGAYLAAGAGIASRDEVFARAGLVVKVKEPQAEECARLRSGQVIFTYLHLAADRAQAEALMRSGAVAIGYETVTDAQGRLPLLAPMSVEALIAHIEARQFVNYGLDKVRFLAPVRAGKRVRNRVKVVAVDDKGQGRWLLTTENTVEIEGEDKPALIATALAMLMN